MLSLKTLDAYPHAEFFNNFQEPGEKLGLEIEIEGSLA